MIEHADDDLCVSPTRVTPYTTRTGLQIGCRYEPPRDYSMSDDMLKLQTSLIEQPRPSAVFDAVLWVASVALIVAVANAPAIWRAFA